MVAAKNKPAKKRVVTQEESPSNPSPKPTSSLAEIKKLVNSLNNKFGANAINVGFPKNEEGEILDFERVHTGSISLDIALGGGIPLGRYIEISGGYSATKTTQIIHIVREAQKMGLTVAFIDVEGTTTEAYLQNLGVDTDSLLYNRPTSMEEAMQILLDLQNSGIVQLGVLDSIAALSPNKEQDSKMDETVQMGTPQRLLAEFFRKYQMNNNKLSREGKKAFTVVAANQIREKIGGYGDPEYTPGGRAKGFTASIDIRFRRGDWISEGTGENKEIVGQVVKFKIDKNKTHARMTTGEFDFYFAENSAGIEVGFNDIYKEIILLAIEWGVIERTGSWFVYDGQKYQGTASLVEALKQNPELIEELRKKVEYLTNKKI